MTLSLPTYKAVIKLHYKMVSGIGIKPMTFASVLLRAKPNELFLKHTLKCGCESRI